MLTLDRQRFLLVWNLCVHLHTRALWNTCVMRTQRNARSRACVKIAYTRAVLPSFSFEFVYGPLARAEPPLRARRLGLSTRALATILFLQFCINAKGAPRSHCACCLVRSGFWFTNWQQTFSLRVNFQILETSMNTAPKYWSPTEINVE